MGDYGAIEGTIGHMKRSAIDAFMGEQGWIPDYEYPDRYALWGFVPSWYARPTEEGEGGGERVGPGWDSMAGSFDGIRGRIDGATNLWVGLPSGDGMGSPAQACGSAATQFGAAASGAPLKANGEAAKSMGTVNTTVTTGVKGAFKAPFLDKYDAQFSVVFEGTGAALALLQTAYAAEQKLWPAARKDAAEICEAANSAFATKAGQSVETIVKVGLDVVGIVAGVVTIIASAGTAAPIVTLVGLSKAAADAVTDISKDLDTSTDSYEGIMSALEAASSKLNEAITTQERALHTMVSSASSTIEGGYTDFDLDAYRLRDFATEGDVIAVAPEDADTVIFNMERVINIMSEARSGAATPPSSSSVSRNAAVGIGETGPMDAVVQLHDLVITCLKSTESEYAIGRDLFQAAVDDATAADERSRLLAAELERELATRERG